MEGMSMTNMKELLGNQLKGLTAALNDFCDSNHLPHQSADDLFCNDDLTQEQRKWLKLFREAWESVERLYVFATESESSTPR
jgi:hypothetical protein